METNSKWERPETPDGAEEEEPGAAHLPVESRGPGRGGEGGAARWESGDPEPAAPHLGDADRQRLIAGNLGLVVSIARRYRKLGLPLGDLIQEGNLGLLAAARRFEPKPGLKFSAYAAGRISQTICRALSQQSRTIRIPLRRLAVRRHVAEVEADQEQRSGNECCTGGAHRSHTTEDDARELGVSIEELRSTILLAPDVESLDAPAAMDGRPRFLSPPDPRSPDPCDAAASSEQLRRLRGALSHLPDRLRHILEMRFGLTCGEEFSLAEIARELDLSAERVRQLQQQALELLRRDPGFGCCASTAFAVNGLRPATEPPQTRRAP